MQFGFQETKQHVVQLRVSTVFARNYSLIFRSIAVEREDTNEWSVERKVNAGLNLRCATQASRGRGPVKTRRAKVLQKALKCGCVGAWNHDSIVIACDC